MVCHYLLQYVLFFLSPWQKNDKTSLELIEVPVKDLTFDQLQLLKVKAWNANKIQIDINLYYPLD